MSEGLCRDLCPHNGSASPSLHPQGLRPPARLRKRTQDVLPAPLISTPLSLERHQAVI